MAITLKEEKARKAKKNGVEFDRICNRVRTGYDNLR